MADAAAPETGQSKAKVFISYSRKDMAFANRLEAALQARGFEPLIDHSDIYAFEEWWERIEALITRADTVVFVLSPDAVASEVALKEVAFAASLNKRFAPVVWRRADDKLVPAELSKLNFIFFDDEAQFEPRADRLAEALRTDISWIRQHTDFGEQARRWAQAEGASGLLLRSPMLEQAERWIASRPPGAPAPTDETQAFIGQSRQGATKRRNVLTGSLAAGLVLALALAGLAYWQRGVAVEQRAVAQQNETQAKTERDNATRNFKLAQKTAESLVFDIAQGLRDVQGMRAATVRKILETARGTFEQLISGAPNDLTLQRSRSVMLHEFGDTYQTLGDLEEALKAYRDSLSISQHVVAADPSNIDWQRSLAISYERIGDVLVRQGKLEEALKIYRERLAIAERLATAVPSNTELQRDLSTSYDGIGAVLLQQGKLDEAVSAFRDRLAIAERLAAADPANIGWQRDLAISYGKVGDVLAEQDNLEEALKAFRDGLAIAERLAAGDRSNTRWQRNLTTFYDKVAYVLQDQGKLEEALKAFRDSLGIAASLAAADPSNTELQRDLMVSYTNVGDVLVRQSKLEAALKAFRESLSIAERLATADPSNMQWKHDIAFTHGVLASAYKQQDRIADAVQEFMKARDIMTALVAIAPTNASWKKELAEYEQQISQLRG